MAEAKKAGNHLEYSGLVRRLNGPVEMPIAAAHVWRWFTELSNARSCGMAANPISFVEIESWARLTGRSPTAQDVWLLSKIDTLWRTVAAEERTDVPMSADGEVDQLALAEKLKAGLLGT